MDIRKAHVSRKTSETDIELSICLDGTGKCEADTGIGFFDHMLNSFARHGMFDLSVKVQGACMWTVIIRLKTRVLFWGKL